MRQCVWSSQTVHNLQNIKNHNFFIHLYKNRIIRDVKSLVQVQKNKYLLEGRQQHFWKSLICQRESCSFHTWVLMLCFCTMMQTCRPDKCVKIPMNAVNLSLVIKGPICHFFPQYNSEVNSKHDLSFLRNSKTKYAVPCRTSCSPLYGHFKHSTGQNTPQNKIINGAFKVRFLKMIQMMTLLSSFHITGQEGSMHL